ncbi:MAG: VWA domain-containing protein [Myxococcota bacterium]
MELTGLSLAQTLGVLAAAGAAVLVLYLLKLRRRQVSVPFVKLWEQVLAEKQTTRLFSQLKRILSLLVALSIVAAIAFALGDPRYAGATATGRTLVVLLDASASMTATDGSPDRLADARAAATRIIDLTGPADRMLVAQMDASTTPLTPLTDDPRILREGLEEVRATDVAANLDRGLLFSLDVLRAESEPEVVVISDGNVEASPAVAERLSAAGVKVSFVPIGEGERNVAITAFSVRRYPLDKSQSEVLVELWNPSEADETVELTLFGDEEPVDVQRVTVRAGERLRRFFRNVSGADQTLRAALSLGEGVNDQLPADDQAYARLPERRRARVLAVSEGNLYLSAALLLDEYLDVTEVQPADYPVEGDFDVVIFDGIVPSVPPETQALYLYPNVQEGETGPLEVLGDIDGPYFETIDRRHPLTRWTALSDTNIATALAVRLEQGDRAIARDSSGPLLVTGSRNGHRFVAFTFDVRRSDLPLRVAWPLLLLNTVNWFVEEDAGYVSSYRTGETWYIPAPESASVATVEDPSGESREVPVVEGRAVYSGTRAGFYTLRVGENETVFAANLGPGNESDIAPQQELALGEGASAGQPSEGTAGVRDTLWIYLVFFAAAVLLAEWFTYHRRWTV